MKRVISGALLLVICAAYAEVLPTGRKQQLFENRSFKVPDSWKIPALKTGKKFYLAIAYKYRGQKIQTADGQKLLEEIPWIKDSIIFVSYDELKNPEMYQDLLKNKKNPIILRARGGWMQPERYKSPIKKRDVLKLLLKTQKDFGNRFLALGYVEWSWGGVNMQAKHLKKTCDKVFKIPYPANRDEGAAWWNRDYDLAFKMFQDAGIPIYSYNATCLNHYEARKGVSITGCEIGNDIECSPIELAFLRGASRQYKIPWGVYTSGNGWGQRGRGYVNFNTYVRPDERRLNPAEYSNWYDGPYCGHPLSLQKRYLYASFMAGTNFLQRENYKLLANYDEATVYETDPRILALKDKKAYASPLARAYDYFYENIYKKRDRGISYAPVALLYDKNHGYVFQYDMNHTVGNVPYTTADNQMRAITNTIFPWEGKQPIVRRTMVTGPFGDIFDVITTDASQETIDCYSAIVLVGAARVDKKLAGKLKNFVKNGGLLFMVCEQMTPELWNLAGIKDTGKTGKDSAYARASDFYVYFQEPFEYHKVKLNGAEPLFIANNYDDRIWPVATINRVGKGAVIVGTPVWLNVKGDKTKMHSLFSEIMYMIADELLPVKVHGNTVEVMYNKNKNGWVVTLINNDGIVRNWPGHKPAVRERDTARVFLEPQFEYTSAEEWITGKKLDKNLSLAVPPGETRIIEFHTN